MLSLLKNHPGRALASTFKLKHSVLPLPYVATRHFLTTGPDHLPAEEVGKEAKPEQNNAKLKKKSAAQEKQDKPKPKKITKKDITPPSKRPMSSFATFALEYRAKQQQNMSSPTPMSLADSLRAASVEWANLSVAEKQAYAPAPEAFEEHRLAVKSWQDNLSVEAKRALKVRRRREKGTGHALFLSETLRDAAGDTFGEKASERAAVWKSLSSEVKADYAKRAAETQFGVRLRREAQYKRQKNRDKIKKANESEKKKKAKAKLREAAAKKKCKEKAAAKETKTLASKQKLEAKKNNKKVAEETTT